jgi:hypothetical protein
LLLDQQSDSDADPSIEIEEKSMEVTVTVEVPGAALVDVPPRYQEVGTPSYCAGISRRPRTVDVTACCVDQLSRAACGRCHAVPHPNGMDRVGLHIRIPS